MMQKTNFKPLFLVTFLLLTLTSAISSMYAQELVPLSPRADAIQNRLSGNLVMTGNSIVGLVDSDDDNITYDPNAAYNGNLNNGNSITAYINIDGDPNTFSSSSADISTPRPDCTEIVYAGLYWSAAYYIERETRETSRFTINNTSIAGDYSINNNAFNPGNVPLPQAPGVTGNLVLVEDSTGLNNGCDVPFQNVAQLNGNIAVIKRGACSFTQKVINAQDAGAIAVIVVNNTGTTEFPSLGGGDGAITIPAVGLGRTDGDVIIAEMANNTVGVTLFNELDTTTGNEVLVNLPVQDARKVGDVDFRKIKFKAPGGTYVDLTPDQIIYDGYANTPTNQARDTGDIDGDGDTTEFIANDDVPYVCYANVTSLIDQNNTNGTYTVANMNATIGRTSGASGASGGWVLVVIYEDPLESSKFISTNDGFVQIRNSQPDVDFTYTGFTSLPAPLPVTVRYGVATLEGDKSLPGDQLQLQNTLGNFIPLGQGNNTLTDINPTNNFFNSSVTFNNNHILTRNPPSTNTLGMDIDLFDLNNFGNTLIGNDQMSATFRLSTDQDTYRVFLNAFVIEIVEPEISFVKRVYGSDGLTDISGNNLEPGDELFYELTIENTGNENLVDGTIAITNVLSANIDFIEVEESTLPAGVTYTETTPGTIQFNIPASIVEPFDESISIRIKTQLVSNCEELRDTCSNIIENRASISYISATSGTAVSDQASTPPRGACGDTHGEPVNTLVNIPACSSNVISCANDLTLIADTGYDQYTWSGPEISVPIVTNENTYQVLNPESGIYRVIKEDTDASDGTCMTLTEEFIVTAGFIESAITITSAVSCYAGNDGSVLVDASGGTPPYQYAIGFFGTPGFLVIGDGSGQYTFDGLSAGSYEIMVADITSGCQVINAITIDEAPEINTNLIVTPITTNADGSITISTSGGNPPYTYELRDAANQVLATQLSNIFTVGTTGNYSVNVIDSNGCIVTQLVTVESTEQNPLLEYADEILFCALTGQSYPTITIQDQNGIPLNLPFSGVASVVWQKLDEINCNIQLEDNCPTTDSSCTSDWFDICTTLDCNIIDPGEYRVVIEFTNKSVNSIQTLYFKAGTALGTDDIDKITFDMYPNPAQDIVYIESANVGINEITVFDVTGKAVLKTDQDRFNITSLTNGMYFVSITSERGTSILKLMKN